jgi:hypothetical protein
VGPVVTQTTPNPEKPRRGWMRFSLRTLFILVTVLCCWLAWEMSVVRQRKKELEFLRAGYAAEITTAADWPKRQAPGSINATIPPVSISFVRRWLGDEAIQEIWYYPHTGHFTEDEVARLARIFPEAKLIRQEPLYEPCHPGCFPHGTLVAAPGGPRPIESIRPGDNVFIVNSAGRFVAISVQDVFATRNRLWQIHTDGGDLITTETQPLVLENFTTIGAGQLTAGDRILRWQNDQAIAVTVVAVKHTGRTEPVINLILGNSEYFVAGGYLARSKPPAQFVKDSSPP